MGSAEDHSLRSHSELPPSSADKWLHCHGWRKTVAEHYARFGVPGSSAAADEGTRAHEKFEAHLRTLPAARPPRPFGKKRKAPHIRGASPLHPKDPDFEALTPCLEWVEDQPGQLYAETVVDYGAEFGYVGLTGTVDVILVSEDSITIADLKFGRVSVEARDPATRSPNPQLMCYLLGAIRKYGTPRHTRFRIAILQPRGSHEDGAIRVTQVSRRDLNLFRFDLENAIQGSYAPTPECHVGPWCRKFCDALSSCRAFSRDARRRLAEEPF